MSLPFLLIPSSMRRDVRQGNVIIINHYGENLRLNTRHFSSPLYGIIKGRRSPDSKESETEAKQQDEENYDGGY